MIAIARLRLYANTLQAHLCTHALERKRKEVRRARPVLVRAGGMLGDPATNAHHVWSMDKVLAFGRLIWFSHRMPSMTVTFLTTTTPAMAGVVVVIVNNNRANNNANRLRTVA